MDQAPPYHLIRTCCIRLYTGKAVIKKENKHGLGPQAFQFKSASTKAFGIKSRHS